MATTDSTGEMAEQQAQQYSAPLGADREGSTPPAAGKSLPTKMTDAVRKHPGAALAVILVLVIVVLYLYARQKGWFGLGGGKSSMRAGRAPPRGGGKKKAGAAAAAGDDEADDDPETEELINSINGSGR